MIKRSITGIIFIVSLLVQGCSTFVPDQDSERVTLKYQAGEYVLLQDLNRNNVIFPANSIVKLIVVTGDDWIKIYAYNSSEELLASNRILLMYLFEDDFPDKKFNQDFLDTELMKVVRLKGTEEQPEKKQKKAKDIKIKK